MFKPKENQLLSALHFTRILTVGSALLFTSSFLLHAQDTRQVSEPKFPRSCSSLPAQLSISGGEPSSETGFDTSRIQAALDNCAAGSAVELTASGTDNAFLIQPITIPSGVTLLVDAGVTVFASRNPTDYQQGSGAACGVVSNSGGGCRPLIKSTGTTGSGIMGYGIIDGRGWDDLIVNGTTQSYSWYSNTLKAYVPRPVLNQNNFDMVDLNQANNFTLYKITLKDSPEFNIHWYGQNGGAVTKGLTIWGIKIISPNNISNTDGIDPADNSANVTITDSFISNGDDNVAISSTEESNPVSNVSITNLHTYSGFGISIGSRTQGGINNVLVDTIVQSGYYPNTADAGLKIKSSSDRGGVVNNVTYQHICQQNEGAAIRIYPYYTNPSTTAYIPTYSNITVRDVTILANPGGGSGSFTFQGYDANHMTTLTLDNLNVMGTPNVSAAKPQDTAITLGPGPVNPAALQQLSGTGVSYSGSASDATEAPYPCTSSSFQPLTGELLLSTATATNLQTFADSNSTDFTLNAVVEPASAEYAALTKPITFYDGNKAVGTAGLGGNGTLATLSLSNVSTGTHTYTAQYPADSNYSEYSFGSVTVTVPGNLTSLENPANPILVSAYLVVKGTAAAMALGGTLQFTAYGTYSDGSVVALPDAEGAGMIAWNTSNHAVAKISTLGHATAMGVGTVNIEAMIGTIHASPLTVTVTAVLQSISPDITVTSPVSGTTVILPALVQAHNIGCGGLTPLSFGYTVDNESAFTLGVTAYDINTTNQTITAGTHTIHFKSWNSSGMCPVVDSTFTGGEGAGYTIPSDATSSGELDGSTDWEWNHDPGTPGSSTGSTAYPISSPSMDGAARKLYFTYSDSGGEIYHLTFAHDTTATHFVYDTYIYLTDPTQVENIEMDMNQVTSDGETVILATQCASGSGTWEWTVVSNGGTHWHPSNIPCDPKTWTANTWHHVQIATHRDDAGNVTHDWVSLDGTTTNFQNAVGPSAEGLGWAMGDLLLNFQLDGAGAGSQPITAYIDKMTIYRW